MKETKVEAKTIQDAVEIGLIELGLRRDQVEVVVVSEGTKGFLGLGAKKACVMLREKKWTGSGHHNDQDARRGQPSTGRRNDGPRRDTGARRERYDSRPRPARQSQDRPYQEKRPDAGYARRPDAVYQEISLAMEAVQAPEDAMEHAKLALTTTLKLMGHEAGITDARHDAGEGVVSIKFDCPDSAVFTAENARGLQSLQFLVNSIINKSRKNRVSVRIDTADYWNKKEAELTAKVESVVKDVVGTARPYRLEPMPAPLRKFVHSLIKAKYPEVETISEGEGKWRKVVIRPVTRQEAAK